MPGRLGEGRMPCHRACGLIAKLISGTHERSCTREKRGYERSPSEHASAVCTAENEPWHELKHVPSSTGLRRGHYRHKAWPSRSFAKGLRGPQRKTETGLTRRACRGQLKLPAAIAQMAHWPRSEFVARAASPVYPSRLVDRRQCLRAAFLTRPAVMAPVLALPASRSP